MRSSTQRVFCAFFSVTVLVAPVVADGPDEPFPWDDLALLTEVDFDPETRTLWAEQEFEGVFHGFSRSQDAGKSWQTGGLAGAFLADADLAAIGGYVYIGALHTNGVVRIGRHSETVAGFQEKIDFPVSGKPIEIAMASNADTFANRAYAAVLTDEGRISVYYKDTNIDGDWHALGAEITDADRGLSLHYNDPQTSDSPYLVLSYLKSDDRLFVHGATSPDDTWEFLHAVEEVDSSFGRTRITAYRDTLLVAYEQSELIGPAVKRGIFYSVSHDGGSTWDEAPLFVPEDAAEPYTNFDIEARGGQGIAAVAIQATSPPTVQVRLQRSYISLSETWKDEGAFNDEPVGGAVPITISWIGDGFGVSYRADDGLTYFDASVGAVFANGFESGNLGAWSSVTH